MSASPLSSLVLAPVAFGALSLVIACVAGARTDRLADVPLPSAADTVAAAPAALPAPAVTIARHAVRVVNVDSAAAPAVAHPAGP